MPTPSKPISVIKQEGNVRRLSKKAIEHRERLESQLMTGIELKENEEVASNEIAHKEFLRLKALLKNINKDDDLTGHVINTHCLLVAECNDIQKLKETYINNLDEFESRCIDEDITFTDKMKIKMNLQKQILDCDKLLMQKRKLLFDIGKENILTIASALRSIPKKPVEQVDPLQGKFGVI